MGSQLLVEVALSGFPCWGPVVDGSFLLTVLLSGSVIDSFPVIEMGLNGSPFQPPLLATESTFLRFPFINFHTCKPFFEGYKSSSYQGYLIFNSGSDLMLIFYTFPDLLI